MVYLLKKSVKDHPHIRGDHFCESLQILGLAVSPPHTWGPLEIYRHGALVLRITPTYVGTTGCYRGLVRGREDHPHIRGDHLLSVTYCTMSTGSPPHTWGPR